MIRKMEFKDIEAIKEIDKICFKVDNKRTTEGILGYMEASNNSSIVYEEGGKVIGFNFIHIWGSFAWFGPLGVHPEYKNKGIGKALVKETIKILREDYKVSTIGLNTMPESQYNVGFYMSLGFTPLKLSLSLKKQLDYLITSEPIALKKYDVKEIDIREEINYLALREDLNILSREIIDNFDLTSELQLIRNKAFGTILKLEENNTTRGIIICYTKSIREGYSKNLQIKLAIMDNNIDYKEAIDAIINSCIKYSQDIKYESISVDCNTYNTEICNYLMSKYNFKIEKTQVMMLMGEVNPFKNGNIILLTRLAA